MADLCQIPAGLLGGFVADKFDSFRATIIACIVQGLVLMAIGYHRRAALINPQQHPHLTFLVLFVIWMTMNSTASPFVLPMFSKVTTVMEARYGNSEYDDLWVVNHFVCALGLLVGGLAGGYAYEAIVLQFLVRVLAGCGIIVSIATGFMLPWMCQPSHEQGLSERLVQGPPRFYGV